MKELDAFGMQIPYDWGVFSSQNHIEFAKRLREFRGNPDLSFSKKLRGGEGQLFETPLKDNLAMKRWFESRVPDMPESIELLKEATYIIDANSGLSKIIKVVDVSEQGSDWIIRGFDQRSIPIKNLKDDMVVLDALNSAKELLTKNNDDISKNIIKKLEKLSANVHWSFKENKLLIIDMQ